MRRFDRKVSDECLINEMLKMFDVVHVGFTDENCPYVVPMNFGYEIKDHQLYIYVHSALKGKKVELAEKHPCVSVTFSAFHDFPDCKYKGHYHDYRSIMGQGNIERVDPQNHFELYKHGFDLLYTCNHRETKPLDPLHLPPMYLYCITCDMKNVSAKSEFPIRNKEDIPLLDVYSLPHDETPFDISDLIEKHKPQK